MKLFNKIEINPLTIGVLLIGFLTGYIKYMIFIFMIVFIHELGHITISKIFKRKITSIEILPFGGLTKLDSSISENIFEDLLISSGGFLFQTILGFIIILLEKNSLISYKTFSFISTYNTLIIIFNMIPICPLDGYKIFKLITELFIPFNLTFKLCTIVSLLILIISLIYNFNIVKENLFVFIFLGISIIEEYKNKRFIILRFHLERMEREYKYPITKIKKIENMYKNRINYINEEHEKKFLKRLFTLKRY